VAPDCFHLTLADTNNKPWKIVSDQRNGFWNDETNDDVSGDLFNDSLEFRESTTGTREEDRPRLHSTQTEEKG